MFFHHISLFLAALNTKAIYITLAASLLASRGSLLNGETNNINHPKIKYKIKWPKTKLPKKGEINHFRQK